MYHSQHAPVVPELPSTSAAASRAQRRMFRLSELTPATRLAYNISGMFRITGALDPAVVLRAMQRIVDRHSSLRTRFHRVDGALSRHVVPPGSHSAAVQFRDFRGREQPMHAVRELSRALLDQPFDVTAEPPLRVCFCRVGEHEHVCIITAHHLIADFRSVILVASELAHFYELEVGTPDLPPLPGFAGDDAALDALASREAASLERYADELVARLAGIEDLAFSRPAPPLHERSLRLSSCIAELPPALVERVRDACAQQQASPNAAYLAALQTLIARRCGRQRFVVGLPMDARPGRAHRGAIGFLSKPTFITFDGSETPTRAAVLAETRRQVRAAMRRRFLPIGELYAQRSTGRLLPRLNVLFNYFPVPDPNDEGRALHVAPLASELTHADMDLWLTVQENHGSTSVKFELSEDVFADGDGEELVAAYLAELEALCERGQAPLDEQPHPDAGAPDEVLELQAHAAGSFSLAPLDAAGASLARRAGIGLRTTVAPYGQVLQTLLAPLSPEAAQCSVLVALVRFEDFHRAASPAVEPGEVASELVEAVRASIAAKGVPHVLVLCPPTAEAAAEPAVQAAVAELSELTGLRLVDWRDRLRPGEASTTGEALAHVPYRRGFYERLARLIALQAYDRTAPPVKVLAVDADDTLWRGVLGEDGVDGVVLTEAHRALQHRLLRLQQRGVLLALVTKNEAADIDAVFEQRTDLVLGREHFVEVKAGWTPKAERIQALAEELDLGLDSFVFLDDNPVELGRVSAAHPEVLTVRVPTEAPALKRLVEHHPVFQRTYDSRIDRTPAYRAEGERRQWRQDAGSLRAFLDGLELEVAFEALDATGIARASELSLRTNQFNTTAERLDAAAVTALLEAADEGLYLLRCRDRFGDYGITGFLRTVATADTLVVRGLMLSCRVLGRGVEAEIARFLLRLAGESGAERLVLQVRETERNAPARTFVERLCEAAGGTRSECEAAVPLDALGEVDLDAALTMPPAPARQDSAPRRVVSRAAEAAALQAWIDTLDPAPSQQVAPTRSSGEHAATLATLWAQCTGQPPAGPHADFFASGGSSLAAVELAVQVRETLGVELALGALYERPTFGALQALVADDSAGRPDRQASLGERLLSDARLELADVPFVESGQARPPGAARNILLTGATGFVGSHLLRQLLSDPDAVVWCMLRCDPDQDPRTRLRERLTYFGITLRPPAWERVRVIVGDLGAPGLGLDEQRWQELVEGIDAVHHCGARVNFFEPYTSLAAVNVEGTRSILRLCAQGRPKELVHVSTVGVLHGPDGHARDRWMEAPATASPLRLPTGYQQSKWVAERLVQRAAERGQPARIVRLGTVVMPSSGHALHDTDFFVHLIAAMLRVGAMPEMRDIDLLPVDVVARALDALAKAPGQGQIFHLVHPEPLPVATLARWQRLAGTPMDVMPLEEFRQTLLRHLEAQPEDPLRRFRPMLLATKDGADLLSLVCRAPRVDARRTAEACAEAGMQVPPLSAETFLHLEAGLRDTGWLPSPSDDPLCLATVSETLCGGWQVTEQIPTEDAAYRRAHDEGTATGRTARLELTARLRDFATLMRERQVSLTGELHLSGPDEPLVVTGGTMCFSPFDGYRPGDPGALVFLQYRLALRDSEGRAYRLQGSKINRDPARMFHEVTEVLFALEPVDHDGPVRIGVLAQPFAELFESQVRSLRFRPGVSDKDRQRYTATWLAFLGSTFAMNYARLLGRGGEWGWRDLQEYAEAWPPAAALLQRLRSSAALLGLGEAS